MGKAHRNRVEVRQARRRSMEGIMACLEIKEVISLIC